MGSDGGLEKWGYRFWRGNDGDRGATVTMVGTNLDTLRYKWGVRPPVTDSRNYDSFCASFTSAPPTRAHQFMFASEHLFSFPTLLLSFRPCTRFHFTQNFTVYLSISFSLSSSVAFYISVSPFSLSSHLRDTYSSFFHRYRARIWFIARFVTINNNSRACSDGAHAAAHGI